MSTSIQSDKSTTASIIANKKRIYSDLDLGFTIHPVKKSLITLSDIDAVKQSVKNLILTNFYERPFDPNLGGNLRALLFEPADQFTALSLKKSIVKILHEREPRVDDIIVQIYDNADRNAYDITIVFTVVSLNEETEIALQIERLR